MIAIRNKFPGWEPPHSRAAHTRVRDVFDVILIRSGTRIHARLVRSQQSSLRLAYIQHKGKQPGKNQKRLQPSQRTARPHIGNSQRLPTVRKMALNGKGEYNVFGTQCAQHCGKSSEPADLWPGRHPSEQRHRPQLQRVVASCPWGAQRDADIGAASTRGIV